MRVFPDPKTWRRIPSWDWHRAGVEGVRAETVIRAASVADSLERSLIELVRIEVYGPRPRATTTREVAPTEGSCYVP